VQLIIAEILDQGDMRIGIDARYLSHGLVGGVHNHIAWLIESLIKVGDAHEFVLYADTKRPFELHDLPDNVAVRFLHYRNRLSSVYHDLLMRRTIAEDGVDIIHFPANYGFAPAGCPTVITLHDQINILPLWEILRGHPKRLSTVAMMTYLHLVTTQAVKRADMILTVSEYSRGKILEHGNFQPDRVVAIINGPSPRLKRIEDVDTLNAVKQRHRLERPFVLADAIKNPGVLTRAWERLPDAVRQHFQIVFFSRTPAPPEDVLIAQRAGFAQLLVRPSNEDLMALYSMASAFVFPSWIEGLGIPLLEAMTCGAPVIASDRGSIPEVAGDAALLHDVDDIESFARSIERVLTDPAEAARLRERGYARAAQFTWDKTARRVLECYERALSLRRPA